MTSQHHPNSAPATGSGGAKLRQNPISSQSFKIITQYGDMLVVKQGVHLNHNHHHHHHLESQQAKSASAGSASASQRQETTASSRPIIMTFHDLGLNSELQFASFCECDEVKLMMQTFTMIHVNFIGQECPNTMAGNLPDDFRYPSVDQMAECIVDICTQLRVRSFIGLAVGAGAHIVSVLALQRPDLVHGLFLINPIISSCSITEWLYFKMSAIASNHHISDAPQTPQILAGVSPSSSNNRLHHQQSSTTSSSGGGGGFRKLLNAAHLGGAGSSQRVASASPTNEQPNESGASSMGNNSGTENSQSPPPPPSGTHHTTSRLRRLILSRNFRLNLNQHQSGQQEATVKRAQSLSNRTSRTGSETANQERATGGPTASRPPTTGSGERARIANRSQDSCASRDSTSAAADSLAAGEKQPKTKRPPLEYLMYHHFGSTTIQRYRRPSADAVTSTSGDSPDRRQAAARMAAQELLGQAAAAAAADDLEERRSNDSRHSSKSHDSLVHLAAAANRRKRSNSISLTASYLASFASDRQRVAYMQSVYKQYFSQLNSHNLWLFAHSFVKRQTLNLRKDCGAAAHAAAAAAALGTSIYTAFVGMAPPVAGQTGMYQQPGAERQVGGPESAGSPIVSSPSGAKQVQPQHQRSQQQSSPLVAGTKVKRTFTCQTLIMCSSVQMHSERSFKLMSLLNPLQATWIKTDQLLVLEEKPEKVCQALRLFLQGIGYSMSTYERRLRLSSAQGSASSASSTGSGRSLSESKVVY